MKTYAQKDYPQTLGKSEYTIAEAGAFLTSLSNLLNRFDHDVSPLHLQNFFSIKGLDASKLTPGAISVYDAKLAVKLIGVGAPESNESIVKMRYVSKLSGQEVSTYCLVDDITKETIIDSFDGIVKSWNVYGGPVSFITFARYNPISIIPLKAAQVAPEAVTPSADTFTVPLHMNGYGSLHDAIDRHEIAGIVNPGAYFVFEVSGEAVNVTATIGQPGLWINTLDIDTAKDADNDGVVDDSETVQVRVQDEPKSEVLIDLHADDEIDTTGGIFSVPEWQKTYKPGLGSIDAIFVKDTIVTDLEGVRPDKPIDKGETKTIVGKFEKDGDTYFRTKESVEADAWYGIPRESVRRLSDIVADEDEFDNKLQGIIDDKKQTRHDKIVKSAATIEGKVASLLKFKKQKGQKS